VARLFKQKPDFLNRRHFLNTAYQIEDFLYSESEIIHYKGVYGDVKMLTKQKKNINQYGYLRDSGKFVTVPTHQRTYNVNDYLPGSDYVRPHIDNVVQANIPKLNPELIKKHKEHFSQRIARAVNKTELKEIKSDPQFKALVEYLQSQGDNTLSSLHTAKLNQIDISQTMGSFQQIHRTQNIQNTQNAQIMKQLQQQQLKQQQDILRQQQKQMLITPSLAIPQQQQEPRIPEWLTKMADNLFKPNDF